MLSGNATKCWARIICLWNALELFGIQQALKTRWNPHTHTTRTHTLKPPSISLLQPVHHFKKCISSSWMDVSGGVHTHTHHTHTHTKHTHTHTHTGAAVLGCLSLSCPLIDFLLCAVRRKTFPASQQVQLCKFRQENKPHLACLWRADPESLLLLTRQTFANNNFSSWH